MTSFVETGFGKRTFPGGPVRPAPRLAPPLLPERLAGLDLLRLIAAIAVLSFHFGYAGPMRGMMQTAFPELASVAKYGFLGVDLFFLISGFVIAASATGRSWHQFAVSRFVRLYPAHVFCMTLTAIVLAVIGSSAPLPPPPTTLVQWLANLSMVSLALGQPFMDGAYWSIVLEIVFYGWVGIFIALGIFQRRLLTILAVWLAIAFVNEAFFQWRPMRFGLLTEYAGMFASGILIHRIRSGGRSLAAYALLGLAAMLGAMHAVEVQRAMSRFYADTVDLGTLLVLHGAIYAVFCSSLWISRLIPSTPLVLMLGGLTYPLYLVHQNAGEALIDVLSPSIGRWSALATALLLVVAASWIAYRFVEPFGRRWLKHAINHGSQIMRSPIGVTTVSQ